MRVNNNRMAFDKPDYSIDISNVTMTGEEGFNEEIVEYAKRLKATNPGHSDSFYLKYAQYHFRIKNNKQFLLNLQNRIGFNSPFAQWAGYTYDEIINMANNGFNIPEEVLEWVKSQYQIDETSYIVTTDDITGGDIDMLNTLESDLAPETIEPNIQKYIVLAQRTQTMIQKDFDSFSEISEYAQNIKTEKENSYKQTLEQISNYTKELKEIVQKSKRGELSDQEKDRYNELKNILASDSSIIIELKNDDHQLKDFLKSISSLRTETANGITIAKETMNAAKTFSNTELDYSMLQNLQNDSAGSNQDPLLGATPDTIADVAFEIGNDLNSYIESILALIDSDQNTELELFAKNYTSSIESVNVNTENIEITENIDETVNEEDEENTSTVENEEVEQEPVINETIPNSPLVQNNQQRRINSQKIEQQNNIRRQEEFLQELEQYRNQVETSSEEFIMINETTEESAQNSEQTTPEINTPAPFVSRNSSIQNSIIELTVNNTEAVIENSQSEEQNSQLQNSQKTDVPVQKSPQRTINKIEVTAQNIISSADNIFEEDLTQTTNTTTIKLNNDDKENEEQDPQTLQTPNTAQTSSNIETSEDEIEILQNEEQENIEEDAESSSNETKSETEEDDLMLQNQAQFIPDEATLESSAAVNANITKNVSTSEKEDRKLTRFNNDSIIESKKKKKKVTAVSSARGGNV
ncbi:hypothetical protein IJ579_07860 [bacterium]|nr:hypothetical protein [bacterium]